jgi:hypothetical protein
MQPDFMAMAQGQQAPAQDELSIIIQNITNLVKQAGIEQEIGPEKLQKQIQELAQLMLEDDQEAVEDNKLYQIIMQMLAEAEKMNEENASTGGPVPQQGAPTKDFASMMPPAPGGGLGGR